MKKIISTLLVAILFVVSVLSIPAYATTSTRISLKETVDEYAKNSLDEINTKRYYFLMPDGSNGKRNKDNKFVLSWYNEFTDAPAIYWNGTGILDAPDYPGFTVEKADSDCVFYADVPDFVTTLSWNNNIDYRHNDYENLIWYVAQTVNIPCDFYETGESNIYPNGLNSFDNMIYVLDPDFISFGPGDGVIINGGEWYYYYGDGCYGTVESGNDENCLRGDHDHTTEYIFGDVNDDGKLTILDATNIQLHLVNKTPAGFNNKLADIDRNGKTTILDATAIQRKLAKLD